ncbi:MAG: bifunctional diaminohydroxyphosphoribosylaminopyrimidine deaminase/5-amino-6-(5-phosphoribosylamino)uracil reductase RibD, partial [Bacteroidia bacterium]|nr:bifunctional diaminohydroxyphosphoribosylaminopyrimidine deaminase/5-amino-6-(5-phosphoribosylamino)uracil reductase RibD [Bacteroidia bacterium]
VQNGNGGLISQSDLYVSLEPCSHFGKTPPCTDLIIKNKIPKVIIGCRDPFKKLDARLPARAGTDGNDAAGQGNGIEKLEAAGVEVVLDVLENECKEINKRFMTFHTLHRPYIILKWAQTADCKIALPPAPLHMWRGEYQRLFITNEFTNRLVHKWRSEEAAILVGTNTALMDNPELTTRLWPGPSPVRLVVDMDLKLPSTLKIFNQKQPTIVFNAKVHSEESEWAAPSLPIAIGMERVGVRYYQVTEDANLVHQIVNALYQLKIQSVIVEGGAQLQQSFIDEGMWDEARVISNGQLVIDNGLPAPHLKNTFKTEEQSLLSDSVEIYKHSE